MRAKTRCATSFGLLFTFLFHLAIAGRFGDIARNGGYHPNLKMRGNRRYDSGSNAQQDFRFLREATERMFEVDQMSRRGVNTR